MLTKKYYKLIRVSYADSDLFQINNVSDSVGTITVNNTNIYSGGTLQYSTDGATFTTATFTSNVCEIELPVGGNCYFKGTNFRKITNGGSSAIFNCNVNHNVKGNLYSLIDPTNYASATTSYDYLYYNLFFQNTHLIDASGLLLPVGVTSVGRSGLYCAFQGCTSLTTAPDLSGIVSVGNYGLQYAFNGCTSLTTAPDLSNVTSIGSGGLYLTFNGCTSLTTAPDLSGIVSVGTYGLYCTFQGCTSLTTAPDLSNVTSIGDRGLYQAFYGCTSLTTALDLSNVTSIGDMGLYQAFYGCTSLTTAPDLSNVTSVGSGGLYQAFQGCSHLTDAYAPSISTWDTSKFNGWLYSAGSSATGTKTVHFTSQTLLDSCPTSSTSGIPSGWVGVVD